MNIKFITNVWCIYFLKKGKKPNQFLFSCLSIPMRTAFLLNYCTELVCQHFCGVHKFPFTWSRDAVLIFCLHAF